MSIHLKLKTSCVENNGVLYLRIPIEGREWTNLNKDSKPTIQLEEKSKGRFISAFLEEIKNDQSIPKK